MTITFDSARAFVCRETRRIGSGGVGGARAVRSAVLRSRSGMFVTSRPPEGTKRYGQAVVISVHSFSNSQVDCSLIHVVRVSGHSSGNS